VRAAMDVNTRVRALLERRDEGRVKLVIPPGRVALAVGQAVYIL